MENWKRMPWVVRMALAIGVMVAGGVWMYFVANGGDGLPVQHRGGPFIWPGLVILLGLGMFATSFPQDHDGGYNF